MKTLTPSQISFLQRYADGEATLPEQRDGKELLKTEQAQAFLADLATLQAAARVADEAIWATNTQTADTILAATPGDVMSASLEDLHPLLERFFDGECDDVEATFVAELIDARPEVADYLAELDTLRAGVRVFDEDMGLRADLSSLWSGVESRLAQTGLKAEQKALLNRYFDGEVNASEKASASALLEADGEARSIQAALEEIRLATQAAMDTASDGVNFAPIWEAVEAAMDADIEAQGDNIVALGARRREKSFFQTYRQSIFGAVAALVAVAFVGSLFGPFMAPERVIVEKTIVIVDSVEYAPGASVMVNSPVQRASVVSEPGSEVEEPTVIWLLDSGEETLEETNEPSGQPI